MNDCSLWEEVEVEMGGLVSGAALAASESEIFVCNLPVRVHFIIVMIRWTGLAPWVFEFPFPGSQFGEPGFFSLHT